MMSRCHRIDQNLARKGVDLRVIGFYRHTGNLVLETAALHRQAVDKVDDDTEFVSTACFHNAAKQHGAR